MAKFYVYTLAYPPEMGGAVFYVGKGQGNRVEMHELEAQAAGKAPRHDAIRAIHSAGYQVVKGLALETDDENEAYQTEKHLIALYGRDTLTNQTNGGGGSKGRSEAEFEYERTTIQLVPKIMEKLDRIRAEIGVSRSAMLAFLIHGTPED